MAFVFTCLNAEQVILSFLDNMPNRSYPLAGASWAFIRWAFCLEANLNVKREMSESFGKPIGGLFEQVGALERLIDFQASLQSPGGVLFQVVRAMQQQPSQALNGFLGRSVLCFPSQFTSQIIETFVHQLHDMKAVESQNRVWRVGSHAAAICSAHVHGHRFEPNSAELEAAPELTQSLCPAAFPHPDDTSALYFDAYEKRRAAILGLKPGEPVPPLNSKAQRRIQP